MGAVARIAFCGLWVGLAFLWGCDDDSTSSRNRPPAVMITSDTPASIYFDQTIEFSWEGYDPDGNLSGYYAGLDDNLNFTSETSTSYGNFDQGTSHTFQLFAVDRDGARSDTSIRHFEVLTGAQNIPPDVNILSGPPDSIFASDLATFTWQGTDPDGNLAGYYAGLDDNLNWTTDTTASFSRFNPGSSYLFKVVAKDSSEAYSDTAKWDFAIYSASVEVDLDVYGEGLIDSDGDGFWSQFNVLWQPVLTSGASVDLRLIIGIIPVLGGAEVLDSTDLVTRNVGQDDTLSFTLPLMTKDTYNIRVELHGADGTILQYIPYNSIPSLTGVKLEDVEGFFAWFDDAWTANGVDELPAGNPDGFFESIELWWDADAHPDAVLVKVVVRERNAAGIVTNVWPFYTYEIEGLGNQDAQSFIITAGSTLDVYDYRLELLDTEDNLLDALDYGEDPDITGIKLGSPGSFNQRNTARIANR